jgi:hypothetical protein
MWFHTWWQEQSDPGGISCNRTGEIIQGKQRSDDLQAGSRFYLGLAASGKTERKSAYNQSNINDDQVFQSCDLSVYY